MILGAKDNSVEVQARAQSISLMDQINNNFRPTFTPIVKLQSIYHPHLQKVPLSTWTRLQNGTPLFHYTPHQLHIPTPTALRCHLCRTTMHKYTMITLSLWKIPAISSFAFLQYSNLLLITLQFDCWVAVSLPSLSSHKEY